MAITINYNGVEIETAETDAEELRDTILSVFRADTPMPLFLRLDAPNDAGVYLLIGPQTSLVMFDPSGARPEVTIERVVVGEDDDTDS